MAKKQSRTGRTPKKRSVPDWAPRFLRVLASAANILHACQLAKVTRSNVYSRRDNAPDFAAALSTALSEAVDELEIEARRRAKDGCEQAVFHQGVEIGTKTEYSDTIMIFLLKAHRPEKYRENFTVKHTGDVTVKLTEMSDEQLAAIASTHEPTTSS